MCRVERLVEARRRRATSVLRVRNSNCGLRKCAFGANTVYKDGLVQ